MPVLLEIRDADKAYADQVLLEGVDLQITDRMRVGLIGRNGAGKSTLCRAILGEEELDGGIVRMGDDCRLGYLQQHDPFEPGEQVGAFLERFTGQPDWRCGEVAGRFAIKGATLAAQLDRLSGGWRTRVKLAALLLQEPNLLLLDEPTNFLDLRTQLLLEQFLASWDGAALIVSHDRSFLAATCNWTAELDRGRLLTSQRTIDAHLTWRAEEFERLRRENVATQARMDELQRFIDSNRANANTASQARSKTKELAKLSLHDIPADQQSVAVRIPEISVRDGPALVVDDLSIGYGETTIASGIEIELNRGDHLVVVGDNGQGKTTLVRTLAGSLDPVAGKVRWTHGSTIGVYGQHVFGSLPEERSVEEHLTIAADGACTRQAILAVAGSFLFRGDAVKKPIGVLSGGERARLVLAALLLHQHTVLILDEPTNHLDLDAIAALTEALKRYQGTLLVVSHDRGFLADIGQDVLEVDNGQVHHWPDGFASWFERTSQSLTPTAATTSGAPAASTTLDPAARKAARRRAHDLSKQIASLDRRLAKYSAERDALQASASDDHGHARLAELTSMLEQLEEDWLTAQEELEQVEAELAS